MKVVNYLLVMENQEDFILKCHCKHDDVNHISVYICFKEFVVVKLDFLAGAMLYFIMHIAFVIAADKVLIRK